MAAQPYAAVSEALGLSSRVRCLAPAVAGFAAAVGVAFVNGGYFPTSWGLLTVGALALAAGALVRGRLSLTRADSLWVGALAALLGWTALSVVWSRSMPSTVLEVERTLAYAAVGLALVLIVRRESAGALLGGALAGIVAVAAYGVGTRVFPDRIGSFNGVYRLDAPLGYWNGVGLYCAMGVLLAIGLAARHGSREGRALAAAALPVLSVTIFFTFSRGAWVATALGLVAMLLVSRERLRLLARVAVLTPASAVAVALASRSDALTRQGSPLAEASREGHRLAPAIALLAVVSALSLLGLSLLQRRVRLSRRVRLTTGIVLSVVAVLLAAAISVKAGPAAVHGFTAKESKAANLNDRVLSFSSNGRIKLWKLAAQDAGSAPLLGSGAGTYEQFFYEHRDTPWLNVRDAHNLYLETLAELGPAGLAVLLLALGLPLLAAWRARGDGIAVAAAGAYVAYLGHAAWDWDWELPAVTLVALVAAAVLLARARGTAGRAVSTRVRVALAIGLAVPAAFAAVTGIGNRESAVAERAVLAGNWAEAAKHARVAGRLAPWSAQPLRTLAQAQLADGDFAGAAGTLRRAIDRDPRNRALWLDLAIATEGFQHALALDRARALDPLSPLTVR